MILTYQKDANKKAGHITGAKLQNDVSNFLLIYLRGCYLR